MHDHRAIESLLQRTHPEMLDADYRKGPSQSSRSTIPPILIGKVKTTWTSGNTVIINTCGRDGTNVGTIDITCTIYAGGDCACANLQEARVVRFIPTGATTGDLVGIDPFPMPASGDAGKVLTVQDGLTLAYDWPRWRDA